MMYKFKNWEDPQLINPVRTINLIEDKTLTAYYEVIEMRKGAPSESNVVNVTVHPKPAEPTVLTLATDKTEYISGDAIILTGTLKYQSDDAPLSGRNIDIYENDVKITSGTTDANGTFTFSDSAEDVDADIIFKYKAKFTGDA